MGEDKKKFGKKYLWLLLLLLALFIFGTFWFMNGQRGSAGNKSSGGKTPTPTVSKNNQFEGQETREITLNFRDTYLVLTGYPYINKDYRPRLYNLIYIDTIFESNDMVNLTDPSGKWKDAYEFSRTESKIYIPLGRTSGNSPIWQTMEIISKEKAMAQLGSCAETLVTLTGNLKAFSYSCEGDVSCFVPINENAGMLYREFSGDKTVKADTCEVLKNNYIFSFKLKSSLGP
ncbi:MAG: hypothetical protein UU16_C0032G0009 [Candidatus Woesebacteria bacterium GW2011_GWA2_40_7]|uniref:Uncharacterized protein n=3 Tax=Candidatus Woeseibacteriota TaxID=1752722 RepID=A0A0G0X6B4_9BACT|nr:MAG: hypothetical protein UT17_C0001G0004 [Candidatus Woesebacteria bacterium GW2011_GWB1_39_10]KKR73057.1 MAG: hypothetical protein UU16_C0032G0009 [Candidatus Woesebacteria bacterium GW2011_GWA2_40_7]KKR92190.1 MAG: hypothetical protein UU42_C0002G0004 [Candidatus Woesebacteria bacterium GW2011_GWA1_41_13b]